MVLFVVDAGGGHRAAANALLAAAEARGSPLRLRAVNIQEVLSDVDPLRRLSGRSLEDAYNHLVRRSRTRHLVPLLRVLQLFIRVLRRPLARRVVAALAEHPPRAVVSLVPNFNAVLRDAARRLPGPPPFVVLLTDLADFPPHFWLEPGVDGAIVPTEEAARQARAVGLPSDRVWQTSGLLLHPRFDPGHDGAESARVRTELGFGEREPAVLVLFGGKGSSEVRAVCQGLLQQAPAARVVAVCGDNPPLFEALGPLAEDARGRLLRFGFTSRVAELMAACDLLVTKPGPGSLSEAFQRRIPVVVCGDDRTIPQERFNVRLVEESGLGLAVASWREAPAAAARLLADPTSLAAMRARLENLPPNRAVWEALARIEGVAGI